MQTAISTSSLASPPVPAGGAGPGGPPGGPHPFTTRLLFGIVGVFVAAMMSGLNSRIGGLTLSDLRAVFGAGSDDASWISSGYSAFELAAMPFATWFAVTLSFRRFHIGVVVAFALLAIITPFAPSLPVLIGLRCLQGFVGGLLIPLLMAAALRFFPLPLRLYGLAMYAMTATFAPNIATWLSATATDTLSNWHLIFWQVLPLAAFSIWAVAWGLPQDPCRLERLKQINWLGLVTGLSGLVMLALGLGEGERYDWFNDAAISGLLFGGVGLFAVFLLTEWFHPLPFIKLQLLHRRNLGLGFTIFFGLLIVLLSGSLLPAEYLGEVHGFRPLYTDSIGLSIGLPQFVVGPLVSFLLYKKWMDARYLFAGGLALLSASCFYGASISSVWIAHNFLIAQTLQACGQPMAVISLLFLATSVVQPMEGPLVSGIVNVLRALGTLCGDALLGRLVVVREKMHDNVLLDHFNQAGNGLSGIGTSTLDGALPSHSEALATLAERIGRQAYVLAISDAYWVLAILALLLIPLVLRLQYMKPPVIPSISK